MDCDAPLVVCLFAADGSSIAVPNDEITSITSKRKLPKRGREATIVPADERCGTGDDIDEEPASGGNHDRLIEVKK